MDRTLLAEKVAAVERHLARVAARLPADPVQLKPSTDASDAVILHLWQAVQIVIDLAVSLNVESGLGTPTSYADAFRRLEGSGVLRKDLAERLSRAAGFRNVVAHAYEGLDMLRIHRTATTGPADLLEFLRIVSERTGND